ncbi:L-serine ammonia-lyase, iron-sulfur-dependent, subunit alpha, partial [Halobacillus sp. BBL2006]|uniref:L-serine ammonia-lyase, iron-sulfur-dependent, subunit alpha n=1 Tax=Halobacillus sp. BBL2006 TaxID=1543706 RepID=UPI000543B769
MFRNVAELVELAESQNIQISEVMIRQEMEVKELTREQVVGQMEKNLDVMEKAIEDGLKGVKSHSGLTGGDAVLIQNYMKNHTPLSGNLLMDAVSKAVATNEVNAAMGTICATPTAGSAGCVPGTLFAVKNQLNPTREQMVRYLFTS